MFRNTALSQTPTYKLILGFSLCTLGGAMLYAYFKTRGDDEEEHQQKNKSTEGKLKPSTSPKKILKPQAQKEVKYELRVHKEHVPLLAGRQGAHLKSLEEKTLTKIDFRDEDDNYKICKIIGYADNAKEARSLLLKEIERSPIEREHIDVPQSVCSNIMGRCGEAMQEICRISLAKVSIDAAVRNSNTRRISITGTRQQINIARLLIENKIDEDESLRKDVDEAEQKREPRRSPTNSVNSSLYSSQTSLSSHLPPREKLMAAKNDEKPMEVYVSAIASPAKFWVQLIGPQTRKLDDLVENMTEYYSVAKNRDMHQIHKPYLGQIVATIFKHDNKWYRAEVVGILPNQYNPNEVVLDLYFVDYGDSEYVLPHEVFELRTDFLTLRFQAVECFLANVKSSLRYDTDTWPQQSIETFEELTQVARWKKLIARVVTYKDRPQSVTGYSAAREGSPIPGVEIYDMQEGVEVNLGHMMIIHGYAYSSNEDNPRVRTPQLSQSRCNSNDALTSSTSSLPQPFKTCSPTPLSPNTPVSNKENHTEAENNVYLNGNGHDNAPIKSIPSEWITHDFY